MMGAWQLNESFPACVRHIPPWNARYHPSCCRRVGDALITRCTMDYSSTPTSLEICLKGLPLFNLNCLQSPRYSVLCLQHSQPIISSPKGHSASGFLSNAKHETFWLASPVQHLCSIFKSCSYKGPTFSNAFFYF